MQTDVFQHHGLGLSRILNFFFPSHFWPTPLPSEGLGFIREHIILPAPKNHGSLLRSPSIFIFSIYPYVFLTFPTWNWPVQSPRGVQVRHTRLSHAPFQFQNFLWIPQHHFPFFRLSYNAVKISAVCTGFPLIHLSVHIVKVCYPW